MVPHLGEERLFPRRAGQGNALLRGHSAAERDGHPAHGPCPQPDDPGRPRALAPDERLQHPLAARHGPRRHRHAERGGEGPQEGGQAPSGPRARGVRRARVGVEEAVRRHDRAPAAHARQLHRLEARALHVRRGLLEGRHEGVLRPLQRGSRLQGQLHRQLVPALRHRPCERRGGARAEPRTLLVHPLSRRGQREGHAGRAVQGLRDGRDDASRNAPRRYGGRRQPEGRALRAPPRQDRDPAAHRARDPRDRGRLRGPRVRHGHREDHARARLERLPRGQASQPRRNQHHERRRHDERARRREVLRHGPLEVPRGDRRRSRGRRFPRPHRRSRQPDSPNPPSKR